MCVVGCPFRNLISNLMEASYMDHTGIIDIEKYLDHCTISA